ncbi:zeta toxin family protein [Allorhodopirellula heiligendammensis]|uniref:Zeta toxin n=1 Tax=Allorhodopirellula heiligendammensis TaxID=2714739 RepID=A0A5C6BF97_9BACT|nr:zeta toxin family protein [Allorhodopirellula heiligendammensis]TWU09959.1 Zeta toxin [Allorhodopirellula heiligendammensis]
MAHQTDQNIYIIAGPNGAGKTTFATRFLPHYADCQEFLNADLIAVGLSPFSPATQNMRASELMLERMGELLANRQTFSFETTLAARSYARRIPEWRASGYRVSLFFLWLPSEDLAIERVANRVQQGGHDIPVPTIRQRYNRGLANFRSLYSPIVDDWLLLDGSQFPPREVARQEDRSRSISDPTLWQHIEEQMRNLLRLM